MSCHIRITGHIDIATAKIIGELVADSGAQHVRSPGTGIYLVSEEDDELCDIEDFLVAHKIEFERTCYRPSQMGQEPHRVTFRPGMTAPETTYL